MLQIQVLLTFLVLGLTSASISPFQQWASQRRSPGVMKDLGSARYHELKHFTQKLDHFDSSNSATWQQRYFISNRTYIPGSPVFLHLGGEWEADPAEIEFTYLGELADKLGAFTIDLEHRFFGKSMPTPDTSTPYLRFHGADQAIEDAAAFTLSLKSDLNLDGPWIVIGASYPANLAAWARAAYPDVFDFGFASSAPSLAKFDFPENAEVTNDALLAADPRCPAVIQASTDELDALIAAGDVATISRLYNLKQELNLSSELDVQYLRWTIAFVVGGKVQYARWGTLDTLCQTLIAGQDTPLVTLTDLVREFFEGVPLNVVAADIFERYRTNVAFSDEIIRPLIHQQCTEYGLYLSLTSLDQPFGQSVPHTMFASFCTEVFGPEFTEEVTQMGVERTNRLRGGLQPNVTFVLYTHGSLDPWSYLGIN